MAILLTLLMSLGLISNPNVPVYTSVDEQTETTESGQRAAWDWENVGG